ncbi:MAG: hypothetical protein KKB51_18225 [Candidatus Riflebacteria bacterium]|nr:hypothetical protein [Candidatus Riflebacteria bacterium]
MTRHAIRNAMLDALEKVSTRDDYYAINHISTEKLCELEDFLVGFLPSIGIKVTT